MSKVKTVGEFVEIVRAMRIYQKSWFEEKSSTALHLSKKYEAQVDAAIREYDERRARPKEPELTGFMPKNKE